MPASFRLDLSPLVPSPLAPSPLVLSPLAPSLLVPSPLVPSTLVPSPLVSSPLAPSPLKPSPHDFFVRPFPLCPYAQAEKSKGGALYSESVSVTFDNVTLDGNKAALQGGAVAVYASSSDGLPTEALFKSCRFVRNEAVLGGGAIYTGLGMHTRVHACEVEENNSTGLGGAVLVQEFSRVEMTNTRCHGNIDNHFLIPPSPSPQPSNNRALTGGACLSLLANAHATVTDSVLSANRGTSEGGAARVSGSAHLSLLSSSISHNTAAWGGAVWVEMGASLLISNNSKLEGNEARYLGGTVYATHVSRVDVRGGSVFRGNSALHGGAMVVEAEARVTAADSAFENNTFSGILFQGFSQGVLRNCSFERNLNAAGRGGAVLVGDKTTVVVHSCSFSGNWAALGGAVSTEGSPYLTINGSDFTRNVAQIGAGVALAGATAFTMGKSVFSANNATKAGGGVALLEQVEGEISGSRFEGNYAVVGGAGVYLMRTATATAAAAGGGNRPPRVQLQDLVFDGNRAMDAHGVAFFDASYSPQLRSTCHACQMVQQGDTQGSMPADFYLKWPGAAASSRETGGSFSVVGSVGSMLTGLQIFSVVGSLWWARYVRCVRSVCALCGLCMCAVCALYVRCVGSVCALCGLCMCAVWALYVCCVGSVCALCGLCMCAVRALYVRCVGSVCALCGLCMCAVWALYVRCVGSVCALCGLCMCAVWALYVRCVGSVCALCALYSVGSMLTGLQVVVVDEFGNIDAKVVTELQVVAVDEFGNIVAKHSTACQMAPPLTPPCHFLPIPFPHAYPLPLRCAPGQGMETCPDGTFTFFPNAVSQDECTPCDDDSLECRYGTLEIAYQNWLDPASLNSTPTTYACLLTEGCSGTTYTGPNTTQCAVGYNNTCPWCFPPLPSALSPPGVPPAVHHSASRVGGNEHMLADTFAAMDIFLIEIQLLLLNPSSILPFHSPISPLHPSPPLQVFPLPFIIVLAKWVTMNMLADTFAARDIFLIEVFPLLFIIILIVWVTMNMLADTFAAMDIFLIEIQLLTMVGNFNLNFPASWVKTVVLLYNIAAFDPDIIGPECVLSLQFTGKFYATLLIPVIGLLVYALMFVHHRWLGGSFFVRVHSWQRKERQRQRLALQRSVTKRRAYNEYENSIVHASLKWLDICYTSVMVKVLEVFKVSGALR
ncbi:unnamed protein product [Closterium sp. Yama58-4]|nr:unnamed protein product [Closterium sp. Yama58-4]